MLLTLWGKWRMFGRWCRALERRSWRLAHAAQGVNVITLRRALVVSHVAGCDNDSSDRRCKDVLKRKIEDKVEYIYRLRRKNIIWARLNSRGFPRLPS